MPLSLISPVILPRNSACKQLNLKIDLQGGAEVPTGGIVREPQDMSRYDPGAGGHCPDERRRKALEQNSRAFFSFPSYV